MPTSALSVRELFTIHFGFFAETMADFFFHWVSLCTLVAKKEKSIKVDHKNVFKDIDQKGTNSMLLQNSNLSFDYHHSVFSFSQPFFAHTTTLSDHTTKSQLPIPLQPVM